MVKLSVLHLDWIPVIPLGKQTGSDGLTDKRDSSCFRAEDGWTIIKLGGGEFVLRADWMPNPVVIGDGYTYTVAPDEPVEAPAVYDAGSNRQGDRAQAAQAAQSLAGHWKDQAKGKRR